MARQAELRDIQSADAGDRIAFIDESMRWSGPSGMYLVSAVVILRDDRAAVEQHLRSMTSRSRRRVHWHHEGDPIRFQLMEALATLPLCGVTVVVEPATPRRQEKAREVAFWNLLAHLDTVDVTELVIEARQEQLNRRDRRTIRATRRAGIGTRMEYRFERPTEDAGLWLADALAGALGLHLAGGDDRYIKRLPDEILCLKQVAC